MQLGEQAVLNPQGAGEESSGTDFVGEAGTHGDMVPSVASGVKCLTGSS